MTAVQPIQSNGIINAFALSEKEAQEKDFHFSGYNETGLDGPDQVLPAEYHSTTKPEGRVRLKMDTEGPNSFPPISVPGLLSRVANKYPDHIAIVARPDATGQRKTYTYREYESQVRIVAKAFLKLGLERFHSVCILGFNSPEWFFADIGAIYAGGFAAGIYATNTAEACQFCAESSQANIIVVEDTKQLQKILQVKHNLPHLKAIIQYEGTPTEKDVLSWNDLIKLGEQESDEKLNAVLKTMAVNQCCTLVYTSGTIGNPKAVMLSHDNVVYDAHCIQLMYRLEEGNTVLVSYLPLSHVAAQIIDIYCGITLAGTIYFADKNALKGSLIDTLLVARPTIFVGVPRVWEKIYERMQTIANKNGYIKTLISSWAKAQGLYYNTNKINGTDNKHWGYIFAKWLVFSKVRMALGLDRSHICVTAAAPLSNDIKRYFMSLDITIFEAYGMSESSGAHILGTAEHYKLDSVGKSQVGLRTKIDNPDSNGIGEICMNGRHVFMGYLNDPQKTAEVLDADRWLHSGDLGKEDSDGFVYVTGRIKELLITAGGENIPPVHIEQLVLAELPALSNVLLIGDKRKYLTMLVTLKTEINIDNGAPKDTFTSDTLKWLQSIGSKSETVTDVLKTHDPLVYEEIDKALKRANTKVISNAQKVQKFRILPHDFSVSTGELGPTLKMKRSVIHKKYQNLIEDMYK